MLNIRGLEYESPSADWLQIRQWVGDRDKDAKEEKVVLLECDLLMWHLVVIKNIYSFKLF